MRDVKRWLVVIAVSLGLPGIAHAQATLLAGLGGPLGFGTSSLSRGSDSVSSEVSLTPLFPTGFDFYGRHYTSVFVNTNGNLSFGTALPTFTPTPFPLGATSRPMIAAWWADVDTTLPLTTDANQNLVYYAVDTTNMRFVATWSEVGYFSQHDALLNSFQIVLTVAADGHTFDVELRYARCEWTTGDANGGIGGLGGMRAQAGLDAANGIDFLALPGSRTSAVLDLCTTSNVAMPGVWDLHGLVVPVCGNGIVETGEECDEGGTHVLCDGTCHRYCLTIYPDGAIVDPRVHDANLPDANLPDAFADDAGMDADLDADIDAGASVDAGNDAGLDAAVTLAPCAVDAGARPDAAVVPDAGRRPDAGTRFDAGAPRDAGRDAGPPRPANTVDVTGGGCGCRVGMRARSGGLYAAAMFFALQLVRRRSRMSARA